MTEACPLPPREKHVGRGIATGVGVGLLVALAVGGLAATAYDCHREEDSDCSQRWKFFGLGVAGAAPPSVLTGALVGGLRGSRTVHVRPAGAPTCAQDERARAEAREARRRRAEEAARGQLGAACDGACAPGLRCDDGRCARIRAGSEGGSCFVSGTCDAGLVCDAGLCAAPDEAP